MASDPSEDIQGSRNAGEVHISCCETQRKDVRHVVCFNMLRCKVGLSFGYLTPFDATNWQIAQDLSLHKILTHEWQAGYGFVTSTPLRPASYLPRNLSLEIQSCCALTGAGLREVGTMQAAKKCWT